MTNVTRIQKALWLCRDGGEEEPPPAVATSLDGRRGQKGSFGYVPLHSHQTNKLSTPHPRLLLGLEGAEICGGEKTATEVCETDGDVKATCEKALPIVTISQICSTVPQRCGFSSQIMRRTAMQFLL